MSTYEERKAQRAAEKEAARAAKKEARYQERLLAIERKAQDDMRKMYISEIKKVINADGDPSYLFPLIKKAGFDAHQLYEYALNEIEQELVKKTGEQCTETIQLLILNTPKISQDKFKDIFELFAANPDVTSGLRDLSNSFLEYEAQIPGFIQEATDRALTELDSKYKATVGQAAAMLNDGQELPKGFVEENQVDAYAQALGGKSFEEDVEVERARQLAEAKAQKIAGIKQQIEEQVKAMDRVASYKKEYKGSRKTYVLIAAGLLAFSLLITWIVGMVVAVGLAVFGIWRAGKNIKECAQIFAEAEQKKQELEAQLAEAEK